jgi:hypothetical protein
MNVTPSPHEHHRGLKAIDAHFGGRASPATERAMRAHLGRRRRRLLTNVRLTKTSS